MLGEIQRRGGIGPVAIDEAIAHARQFVDSCPSDATTAIDLGSGGGLPALVVAVDRPSLSIELVERRAKRVDLLRFGVRALGLVDRVTVVDADVRELIEPVSRRSVDLVTARSFAPPLTTLEVATKLLRLGGTVLISDPPDGATRWRRADLVALGVRDDGAEQGVHRFTRVS